MFSPKIHFPTRLGGYDVANCASTDPRYEDTESSLPNLGGTVLELLYGRSGRRLHERYEWTWTKDNTRALPRDTISISALAFQ